MKRKATGFLDLDEAFAPYDDVLGVSARAMRRYWRLAAFKCARHKDWADCGEAWWNSLKRFPPSVWKTGQSLIFLPLR